MTIVRDEKNLQISLRLKILKLARATKVGHPHIGSCFSCIDILIQTFIFEMRPSDKFILSKGHASLALYVVLNYLKKISDKDLQTYFHEGTEFAIHTPSSRPKEIPLSTGSLGHGLSFAVGLAKGYKLKKSHERVFCLLSDGECNEGSIWEAALFASKHKLDNLIVLIDKNKFQAFGRIRDVLGDGASGAKWRAFGFDVNSSNGHSLADLSKVFSKITLSNNSRPKLIICKTKRAYGITGLVDRLESNYSVIDEKLYEKAVKSIKNI